MRGQTDLFGGAPVRDIVWKDGNAWLSHALWVIDEHCPHGEVMVEDLWLLPGMGSPRSANAKGQLAQLALQAGLLKRLDPPRFEASKRPSNKGHRYEVYFRPGHPRIVRDVMPGWMR